MPEWKKGDPSPNPHGRPKLDLEIKEARKLNKQETVRILTDFWFYTKEQLNAKLQDPEATLGELAIGKILANAIAKGDPVRLNFILERIVGKVKEDIEITGKDGGPIELSRKFKDLPDAELLKMLPDAVKLLKENNE